jgi:hypothetical protein
LRLKRHVDDLACVQTQKLVAAFIASFSRKTVERSFFRKAGLAQAIDNDRWGRRLGQKPFDCELRVETTRLRLSQFRLGVVPLRGLSSRQSAYVI